MSRLLALSLFASLALGHGDHSFDLDDAADNGMGYAERHMHTEHHIDSFDLESFFKLHDLDLNGFWDVAEVEAVYGLHHHSVKERLPQKGLQEGRASVVVEKVLKRLDTNGDRRISLEEFLAGGNDGLPSFEGYKDLGHHYDEESEYFLHHEELYHSTPETQTDEAYNHPEDIAHFRHHEKIEAEEDARERVFEGLSPEADLMQDHVAADPLEEHAHAEGEGPDGNGSTESTLKAGDPVDPPPRLVREAPGATPQRLAKNPGAPGKDDWRRAREEARGKEYGHEHGRPRSAEERLRANVPYKYKWVAEGRQLERERRLTDRFRKGLRADEF